MLPKVGQGWDSMTTKTNEKLRLGSHDPGPELKLFKHIKYRSPRTPDHSFLILWWKRTAGIDPLIGCRDWTKTSEILASLACKTSLSLTSALGACVFLFKFFFLAGQIGRQVIFWNLDWPACRPQPALSHPCIFMMKSVEFHSYRVTLRWINQQDSCKR